MTTTTTPTSPIPGGFAWQKARRLLARGTKWNLPNWPELFAPEELARLQYPREGAASEKFTASRNQRALIETLREGIAAGLVETVIRHEVVAVTESRPDWEGLHNRDRSLDYTSTDHGGWFVLDSPPTRQVKVGEQAIQVHEIGRRAFAAWLRMPGNGFGDGDGKERPSGHILAWLGPEWAASAPDLARRKPPEETMQQRREAVLKQWLDGPGKIYLERGKLTLAKPDAWGKLAEIKGELFRAAADGTIEEFFKNQRLINFKQGRKKKQP